MPSVTIQSYLTFTSLRLGQIPTITFTNGGTAGFEVVTVTGYSNITVQIQPGFSTMLNIKNAIQNSTVTSGFSASQLVSVSITSGHNSDTVQTLVDADLSGGITSSTFATLTLGPIKYVAQSAGTGGNAITIHYTPGAVAGSEIVTVLSNAISVQVADFEAAELQFITGDAAQPNPQRLARPGIDYTTSAQLITAIRASVSASALVVADYGSVGTPAPIYSSSSTTPVHLFGGMAPAAAFVTAQGVTITSNTNNAAQNGLDFSLTTGATAGAEVVTVDGFGNVTVQIQNGVSTITQVVTALNASTPFTTLYAASGSGSTPMLTVNQAVLS